MPWMVFGENKRYFRSKIVLFLFAQVLFVSLAPGQELDWQTAIYAEDNWKYLEGNSAPPAGWETAEFDDTTWSNGAGSIGYGDEDDETIIDRVTSLYMRRSFSVADLTAVNDMVFHADYDDGFVAYLNGVEIARANLEGNPPAHDASTPVFREALMYEGGLPETFIVDSLIWHGVLQEGENVLAIQTNNYEGLVSSDMTTLYWLSFNLEEPDVSYGPTPAWFTATNIPLSTPLPIVIIDTQGEYIPDEPSIPGMMSVIWNGEGNINQVSDPPLELHTPMEIERRGQTSQSLFPKNGYAIETKDANGEDADVSFLNFPEEEDWILHGPYSDKTLIRNTLALEMARSMNQYASRTRAVELVINGQYEGLYIMMEKIKRDENRVDIAKLREEDISGDELTGGYVFKLDKGTVDWYSQFDMVNNPGQRLRFQFVSPNRNNIQPEQAAYIQSYVDSFERAMIFPEIPFGGKRYDEYIDVTSFADHFIISELTKNVDAYRISTYMYKDKDSVDPLIKAGPVWDFNLAFGNANYCNSDTDYDWVYDEHCGIFNPFWWERLFGDETFVNTVKCRWLELRESVFSDDNLNAMINAAVAEVQPAVERNNARWPVLGNYIWPNAVVLDSYEEEVEYLRSFLLNRSYWMDDNIFGACLPTKTATSSTVISFQLWPNPTKEKLTILSPRADEVEQIRIIDAIGRDYSLAASYFNYDGNQHLTVNLNNLNLKAGAYHIQLLIENRVVGTQRLVLLP